MSDESIGFSAARHPSPHRERVGLLPLFYGLFIAPIVWAGNLMITYALATHACFPGHDPLVNVASDFGFAWPLILALFLATLLLCASGFVVSWRNWIASGTESEGHVHHLLDAGEGRTRYLSIIGMAYAVLFFALTVVGAIILAIVPLCAQSPS
jgi:hypothetical protein